MRGSLSKQRENQHVRLTFDSNWYDLLSFKIIKLGFKYTNVSNTVALR